MRLGRYREVLRAPGVARLALFTTIGRLPFGILPFALVLLMREESYRLRRDRRRACGRGARGRGHRGVRRTADRPTATEAYSWQIVANVVGAATGSLLAGLLVEHASVSWALGSAALACAGGFSILVARRRTLGTS
ncbi:MAG TPA: hypothetical protein VE449_01320 [Thermoleophilaceae bacterium]|nr:hypothetical protein [Thermoleophilaceae bacterium]